MFKIGDKVRIRKGTRFHNTDNRINPHNSVVGTVVDLGIITIRVEWPHGHTNSYIESDLGMNMGYTMSAHRFI